MPSILSTESHVKAIFISEAPGHRSFDNVVVVQTGVALASGTLLTKSGDTATTGSAVATAGNTGNPTFGAIAVGASGVPGAYKLTFTAPTKFDVEDPDGVKIGSGTTGVAFNKSGVSFTLTAGGTAAVAGDEWTITVAAGTGKYSVYTPNGAAGPADAVLYNYLPAFTGDAKAAAVVRDAELNRYELTGLDTVGQAGLLKRGLIVRGTPGAPSISTPAL